MSYEESEQVSDDSKERNTPHSRKRRAEYISPPKTCPPALRTIGGAAERNSNCESANFAAETPPSEVRPSTVCVATCFAARRQQEGPKCTAEQCRRLTNSAPFCNQWCCRKPECSYAVLIGVAMRAARAAGHSHHLPVIDIYHYIENEFPYFRKCKTTGWKNCVRHCLSLGQFFRKVDRSPADSQTVAKGNHWEVIPSKRPLLDRDIDSFVLEQKTRTLRPTQQGENGKPKSAKQSGDEKRENGVRNGTHTTTPLNGRNGQTAPNSTGAQNATEICYPQRISITPSTGERLHTHGQDPSDYLDDEDPIPAKSRNVKTLPQVTPLHMASSTASLSLSLSPLSSTDQSESSSKNSNDDVAATGPTTNATVQKGDFHSRSVPNPQVYLTPNNTTPTPNAEQALRNVNNQVMYTFNMDDSGTLPFINPAHPLVNHSTLAFVNSGAAVTERAGAMATPNVVTYTFSPTSTWLVSDLCTPTSSGLTGSRMTHSVFSTTPLPQQPSTGNIKSVVPPSTIGQLIQASAAHRRVLRMRREEIPPELRPVMKHMHDPSHFLPSSQLYETPSYDDNRMRHRFTDEYARDSKSEKTTTKPVPLNGKKLDNTCRNLPHLAKGFVDIVDRFDTISALSDTNSQNFERGTPIFEPSAQNIFTGREKIPQKRCLNMQATDQQQSFSCYNRNKMDRDMEKICPEIVNGQAMLSSVQDITSLINGVADHASYIGNGVNCEGTFFEVANEWMELTIAREEEVTSSEFEEMTSSLLDDVHVYFI